MKSSHCPNFFLSPVSSYLDTIPVCYLDLLAKGAAMDVRRLPLQGKGGLVDVLSCIPDPMPATTILCGLGHVALNYRP